MQRIARVVDKRFSITVGRLSRAASQLRPCPLQSPRIHTRASCCNSRTHPCEPRTCSTTITRTTFRRPEPDSDTWHCSTQSPRGAALLWSQYPVFLVRCTSVPLLARIAGALRNARQGRVLAAYIKPKARYAAGRLPGCIVLALHFGSHSYLDPVLVIRLSLV